MSTRIMALCWPLTGLSILQKAVLISLADQANDQSICWPSVGTICERVCASERAVRRAINELSELNLIIRREQLGKPTYYTLTPARYSPLPDMHPCQKEHGPLPEVPLTPARSATITVREPSIEPSLKPSSRKAFRFDECDMDFAEMMADMVLVITRSAKKPNLESWADSIRLMRESDRRSIGEIRAVFLWANQDSFWRANILSPPTLRKQFDKLFAKMNSGASNGQPNQNGFTASGSGTQNRKLSAVERVNQNIARDRAARQAPTTRGDRGGVAADDQHVRPQMDSSLRGDGGRRECMGGVLEGDFDRAD